MPVYYTHCISICAVKIENPKNGTIFKVNDQQLKLFFELKNPEVEKILLEDPAY